jgi:hypothetical protein
MLADRSAGVAREYIASRNNFSKYPFFELADEDIIALQFGLITPEIYVQINVDGYSKSFVARDYSIKIRAISSVTNPVGNIRSARRTEKNVEN